MQFDFNDEQRAIRKTAQSLLQKRSPLQAVHAAAQNGDRDTELWQQMGELGWAGIAVPEEFGGEGLGMVELCLILEEQGVTLSPTPLLPTACASRLLLHAGSETQQQQWLPKLASGEASGAVGLITATNTLVAGVAEADVAAVVRPDGASLVELTPSARESVETIDPLRSYGPVAASGEALTGDVQRGLDEAALCVAAELLGVAQHCLDVALAYVKQRKQFDVVVGSFQAVGHRLADMLYEVESTRAAVYYAAWTADAAPERLPEAAAMAKYVASTSAVSVAGSAIQAHGGIGFTWDLGLHWWLKRAQLDAQMLGSAGAHRECIAEFAAARAPIGEDAMRSA